MHYVESVRNKGMVQLASLHEDRSGLPSPASANQTQTACITIPCQKKVGTFTVYYLHKIVVSAELLNSSARLGGLPELQKCRTSSHRQEVCTT